MTDLTKKKCVPCEGWLIPFDVSEIHKYQKKWMVGMLLKMKIIYFFYSKNLILKTF